MKSVAVSIDATISGWDAYNSTDNMPPDAAIILDNLIPGAGTVDTRMGQIVYADTGTGLPVETVISLNTSATTKLLACSAGGVFDVTNPLTIGTISAAATFTNDRWQCKNFRTAASTGVLLMCNGVDDAQVLVSPYTSLTAITDTDTVGIDFIGVEVFKGRAYYWKDDDDAFYYSAAGSYQGVLTRFSLGSLVQRGGKLKMVTTWTQQDAGDGKDDFLVFVFSTGEILNYQGDDPESAGFFEMVGRYITAEPLSIRGKAKYGSDTILMTKDGYVALSTIVQEGRISDVPAFSRLIHNAIAQRVKLRSGLFGWDCHIFSKQGLFVFNVPLSATTSEQHVLNTVTQRWCRFTNINVSCLEVHDDELYGGASDGTVIGMLQGSDDLGDAIEYTVLPAYNYFGDTGNQKHLSAIQILSTHTQPQLIQLTGYADFRSVNLAGSTPLIAQQAQGAWSINPSTPPEDEGSFWDEDYWAVGDDAATTKGWQNISAYGYAVSYLMRFSIAGGSVSWRSTNLRYNIAGAN